MAWLTGWNRRKSITVTGSNIPQTDYQQRVQVNWGTGSDSPGNVFLGGNVRTDFGDVRFTSSDGSTLLSYWIESYTSGVSTIIWIKIPSIPATPGTTEVYIYYDNISQTTSTNGDNTFIKFDNFEQDTVGIAPSKWSNGNSVNPGSVLVELDVTNKVAEFGLGDIWQRSNIYGYSHTYTDDFLVSGKFKLTNQSGDGCAFIVYMTIDSTKVGQSYGNWSNFINIVFATGCTYWTTGIHFESNVAGTAYRHPVSTPVSPDTYYDFKIAKIGKILRVKYWTGTEPLSWNSSFTYPDTEFPSANGPTNFFSYNHKVRLDNVRIQKYVEPEPQFGQPSIEELQTGNLSISSTPSSADVYINNVFQTTTPVVLSLTPGSYDLKVSKTGYTDHTETIVITSGFTLARSVTLTPSTGTLSITSTPTGAEIFIDNIDQGITTPQTITGLSAGSHTYKLTKIDYQDATGSFTITSGQTTNLNIPLTSVTCPTLPRYEGNTIHLSAIPKDGTGPYYVEFRKNNAPIATYSNATENIEVTYDYILTNEDIRTAALGTIDFSVYISDLCPTGAQTCTQLCTINIGCLSPVCNFTVT